MRIRLISFALMAPAWLAYAISLNWWENSTHSEIYLKFGNGAEAVYLYGAFMASLMTALIWILFSAQPFRFKLGLSLTFLAWIAYFANCWHWEVMVTSRWTEDSWMVDIGLGFAIVYILWGAVAVLLSVVGIGVSGILSLLWRLNREALSLSGEIES